MIPEQHKSLFQSLGKTAQQMGVQVYVVGGYVRDLLLDKENKDIDFVIVGNGPAFAEQAAADLHVKKVAVYKKFGTAMFRYHDLELEFVGARKESYRGDSRKPDVQATDLMTDMKRRDFTVNAMAIALNPENFGELIDPFNGQKDLKQKVIKTPLAPKKTFYDDPLRIMRAVRFACQLQFTLHHKTAFALKSEAHRLCIISQERITTELEKILASAQPSFGFNLMDKTKILKIIMPEIVGLKGVEKIGNFRHKDVFEHTLQVLDNLATRSDKLDLRWAALYHDIAKPRTKAFDTTVGWTFHGHEEIGARMFKRIGRNLRLSTETIAYVMKMIRLHLRPIHLAEEGVSDSAIRRLLFNAGDDIDDLMLLCRADITSGNAQRVKKHLANFDIVEQRLVEVEEKDKLRAFQPPVRGDEIMQICQIPAGPDVGKIKNAIEEAILNGDIPNEYQAAFDYMLKIKDDILAGK